MVRLVHRRLAIDLHRAHARRERLLLSLIFFALIPCISNLLAMLLGDLIAQGTAQFPFYVFGFLVSLLYVRFLVRGIFAAPELTLLMVLAVVTVLWSVDARLSTLRAFQSLSVTLMAMVLASAMSLNRLVQTLAVLGIVLMLGSVVSLALVPDARGIDPWPEAWRGMFSHKNGLGANATVALILTTGAAMLSRGAARWLFLFGVGLSLLMLVGSQSRTSQLIAILSMVSLLLGWVFRVFPRFWGLGYVAVFVTLIVAGFLVFSTNWIVLLTDVIDRQPTLSGRIPLWSIVWPVAMERPLLGFGFQAFWDPDSARVFALAANPALLYIPYYSHSGLIELIMNTGLVGVVLFVGVILRALAGAFVAARHPEGRIATMTAVVLILAFLMFNVTESFVLSATSTMWPVMAAVCTKLALVLQRRPMHARQTGAGAARARRRGADMRVPT